MLVHLSLRSHVCDPWLLFPCVQDIFKHCTDECITSVTDIPYFDGDFWPNVIEETIKELDQEAKQREASEKDTDVCFPLLNALHPHQ